MSTSLASLPGARILPVLTVLRATMAGPLAEVLVRGGARCAEVTFRTPEVEQALKAMAAHGGLTAGAGTVLTPEQAERAVAAGARFVASPGFDPAVVAKCRVLGVAILTRIVTATELLRVLRGGINSSNGSRPRHSAAVPVLKSPAAPFTQVCSVPTGGFGHARMSGYLAHPAVMTVGDSWMATAGHLERGEYPEIRRLTAGAVARSAA
ncbi:bifunctional 4-hydroxy-2-oxoglutarate aldolase/2-dehydro-3-deoxy-phosphogluconate aldolase [Streptomyces sp. NPDC057950]|uniref:bifunctional 4-hydroxy-2-oxoglutarate aldolase/2-dehydro-3-deoxy-phosphogluconate aldolase n=1 Tax=Streptomyces sp. NPDC057950 TaxID=3346288 RepID=UPI0036E6DC1D